MRDGIVWEPSTQKEIAYYDKLFGVVDRDNTSTLDGKEAVQFLGLSGLTKTQLKDVWFVACSPGQAVLQRQGFYVAMRAVALAQSGDSTVTRERVRETATDSIAMATFKGIPAASVKYSKGKKQNSKKEELAKQEPKTAAPKNSTGPKKSAAATLASTKTTAGHKTASKEGNPGNSVKTKKNAGANSAKGGTNNAQPSEKKHSNKAAVNVGKGKRTTSPERGNGGGSRGDSSSSCSKAASDSDNDGDDSSRSGGESTEDDDDGEEEEDGGPDPFSMSEKARARYQAIFCKVDATGTGSLSGKQVIGLFAKSGLDKAALAVIWRLPNLVLCLWSDGRLSDLDEDGSLAAEEFGIAFHLIFCATQRKLNVPDELPQSLWPAGYVPPSVLARREEEAEKKRKQEEQERRRREKTVADSSGKSNNDAAAGTTKKKKKDKSKKIGAGKKGTEVASRGIGNEKTEEDKKKEERELRAAREAASLQKREELAKKRAEKRAKTKNKKTRSRNNKNDKAPKKKKKKKKKTERSDINGGDNGANSRPESPGTPIGPLTVAERRARKAEARAAKIDAAKLKKETAARDARMAELDLQDSSKTFTVKAMDPMKISQDNDLHMLPDLGEGPLSLARLSAPLPHLTPHPGRPPCIQPQEFSVSFSSGIRRASSLTPSLEVRLGPPKASLEQVADVTDGNTDDRASDGDGLIRCPECAELLRSSQIVQHIRSTCRLLPCTHCSRLLLPADRERHVEEACPNRRRSCMRCGEAVVVSEFARHEAEGGCARRVVPCAACGDFCPADELREHGARECPEREVSCPSCGDGLPARQMAEHASSLCRNMTWACGCGEGPFALSERPAHLKTCNAFIDAWEASIEKVMIATRVENPGLALLALAESRGNVSLAARRVTDERAYINELCLAADIVNVEVFLKALTKPGKRGSGALWRAGLP
ncbi:conserved unknown protein [Ectocarpus siliculosus]|uniref:Uncharacterized protein n=1 Tax=Ectocarpus siliculosus TaxID=2880 RepID=D8LF73_ECTSI|nr:conserved unknown protein [Ectocarpus siliculosus]|eukprot:CBN78671.1 conserved unknown protein [Ectocarpus siliculosus]